MSTALAAELRDPSGLTFDATALAAFINAGVIQVGRIAPDHFQQDITPDADTLVYTLGDPEIEVRRVELWDSSQTPAAYVALIPPASKEYSRASSVGWEVWGGKLYIPNSLEAAIDITKHTLRLWGYGPYPIVSGSTEMPMSTELEYAVRTYARVAALESMVQQRNLFTQWQAQPQNTDITPAGLLQQLSMARSEWHRLAGQIAVIRESN